MNCQHECVCKDLLRSAVYQESLRHFWTLMPGSHYGCIDAGCMQIAHDRMQPAYDRKQPACITLVKFSVNERVHSGRIFQGVFFYTSCNTVVHGLK